MTIEEINGEKYYKIENCNEMRPFFISIVSDSNHWLFIASNGGMSAGRKNAENAIFPYYTDDKIIHSWDNTGSKTIIRIHGSDADFIWEPFSHRFNERYSFQRNLYKSIYGNSIVFEEILHDLNIVYRYKWSSSDKFGFVKTTELLNNSNKKYCMTILDGIQNIMPSGVPSDLQMSTSNLVDAYKRNELHKKSGMGIYALSAVIIDKAEPSESLNCNIVWSIGLEDPSHLLSSRQLNWFRYQGIADPELDIKGERGAYFVVKKIDLDKNEWKQWHIVADVNKNHSQVVALINSIENEANIELKLKEDIKFGTENLVKLIAASDGLQFTADDRKNNRHFSNVLFNVMRGGIFDQNYVVEKMDFIAYLQKANSAVYETNIDYINNLADEFNYINLLDQVKTHSDADLIRLCIEYLPLKFSRRHGDPSRPWNKFSINTKHEDGSKILDYEGNWRDIFQNWEALAYSYPKFIEGMIFKFLNATTFDGYNPYRVTKDGFDWEKIEMHNPWSNIGYWGDHQIIYLLKFLEFMEKVEPGKLEYYLDKEFFVYAAVPYRIKPYKDLVKNARVTIDYDYEWEAKITTRCEKIGADGALVKDNSDGIYRVNMIEKLLATSLSKMSNFVPGGGIWMNTQRPEWNDANNALVGSGLSMVTLYYLRRFFKFFESILEKTNLESIKISNELVDCYHGVREVLLKHRDMLQRDINDYERKIILDTLGTVASDYRMHVYTYGFWGKKRTHSIQGLKNYVQVCLQFIEHSIIANERQDHLFHSYNLMTYTEDGVKISHLTEMLEGQVAALSSGFLSSRQSNQLLNVLRSSSLFRNDAQSYILYPNKDLPKFLEKNHLTAGQIFEIPLLKILVNENNEVIVNKDIQGNFHFHPSFNNADKLLEGLTKLGQDTRYKNQIKKDTQAILNLYELIFDHKSFTGRSGTFFGYEGLGSIYWHMVSKLYLAIAETIENFDSSGDQDLIDQLTHHFYQTGIGLGIYKTPLEYGAFPTDPYSHTPSHRGAQQPGMTGQVKEDIITRFKELGVRVNEGSLEFSPSFLSKKEFFTESKTVNFISINGNKLEMVVPANSLAFSICQTPVVYTIHSSNQIIINYHDKAETIDGILLYKEIAKKIFDRTGEIKSLNVMLKI